MLMKLVNNWKSLIKSYSVMAILGNLLTALSISGLAVVGVLSSGMAFNALVVSAILFGVAGFIGRFIRQDLEDGKMFYEENKEGESDAQ